MDVAFAGCGDVARRYAAGIRSRDDLHLVAVADPNPDRVASLDVECPAYDDVAAMLADAAPQLVVNLTSHATHATVTRTCLEAGRHVYSEKPLAVDPDEAEALVALARTEGLGLGCAPINHRGEHQRLAARRIADGTMGDVRVASATAHVGRVTEWHDRPGSYLDVGPLYDGAVYPLTLLVEWFGPATTVRTADAATPYPARDAISPDRPTHVEATIDLRDGLLVRLTASFYVPHRAREFYGLELHGDDASLYLRDAGDLGGGSTPLVSVGRVGRDYTPVPLQRRPSAMNPVAGVAELAADIRRGSPGVSGARRAAHVVSICAAIERAAESGDPVPVPTCGFESSGLPTPPVRPAVGRGDGAIVLPSIGFGCSRYRDGEYVDRPASIETALDAGYRLLDSAELYGNEDRIGEILAAPGTPDRESLFLISKVWNTNHGHVREACESTLDALGVSSLDAYLLHWPESWQYTGPLRGLADKSVPEQEARAFPEADGDPIPGGVTLEEAWRGLESVHDAGLARTIGVCNVDQATLGRIRDAAEVPPAIVQVERHPYQPRHELVAACHKAGIRVIAHSPLSAPGLLDDPAVEAVAAVYDATPAQVVLAWNQGSGVVPIPSSQDPEHVVENAAASGLSLDARDRARLDALADPSFER